MLRPVLSGRASRGLALGIVLCLAASARGQTARPLEADARAPLPASAELPAATRANAPLNGIPAPGAAPGGSPGAAMGAGSLEGNMREAIGRTAPTIVLFAVASLVPAAVLMVTAFVRISIVLTLLRQALGSPQVPGNQVLAALALLLTALVMRPVAESVYAQGIEPYARGELGAVAAWEAGTGPIKVFMADQIVETNHQHYLFTLYDHAVPPGSGQAAPDELTPEEIPLHVLAPAFLLSELTTALVMGFVLYLPFLVVDLVVSAVLAAMGLFMLPPTLVALPLKLILFVLADGWMLVAGMLLRSFAVG